MGNLRLKGGIYHWRLTVPPDLRAQIGKGELTRSTGTGEKTLAKRFAMAWSAEAKNEFDELRKGKAATSAEITAVAQRVLKDELARQRRWLDQNRDNETAGIILSDLADPWREVLEDRREVRRWPKAHRDEIDAAIRTAGLLVPIPENRTAIPHASYLEFADKLARAFVQVYLLPIKWIDGDRAAKPWDDLTNIEDVTLPTRPSAFAPTLDRTPLASEMFTKWKAEKGAKWARGTAFDYSVGVDIFLSVVGDIPVGQITRDDIRAVRDIARKLPVGWRKLPRYRDQSPREIAASNPPGPHLKPGTINRYLQAPRGMLAFAMDEDILDRNVAQGIRVEDLERPGEKRALWPVSSLNKWFSSPIYNVPPEDRDYRFWLPLLGLYTGAREEELAKLRVEDVREVDGVLCLDINWLNAEERLKNASSERLIPVHSELLNVGFAQFVARRRSSGNQRLWRDLRQSAKGKWAPNFSKWFTRARREHDSYDPNYDFHSFRHHVTTALANAGVPDERIKAVVGHSDGKNVTQSVYVKSFNPELMQQDIELLVYDGLDLTHLRRPTELQSSM